MGITLVKTKICPKCKKRCGEIDARCKECGYRFMVLCEGCGRDVCGYTLCADCRIPGHKRPPFAKDSTPFSGDEWLDYEGVEFGHSKELHTHSSRHNPHFDWDCYDQYKRLQKLNKKSKKKAKK